VGRRHRQPARAALRRPAAARWRGRGAALAAVRASAPAPLAIRPEATLGSARNLRLSIRAERTLNTDAQQGSTSLALRVYVLRDGEAFQRASFDSLYDNDDMTLGAALLRRESLHQRPGETRELTLPLSEDARFVAVLAAYRELDRSQWRTLLALPANDAAPAARLDAQARQVQLAWVH
jgi:type VI secretion system VasD/TssJ family lipoprotein